MKRILRANDPGVIFDMFAQVRTSKMVCAIVFFLCLITVPNTLHSQNLENTNALNKEVQALHKKYVARVEEASKLGVSGKWKESEAALLEILKEAKSPAAAFWIGNLMFQTTPEHSYRLHKEAFAAYPNDPYTNLEWAMEQHRRGEYQKAIPHYRAFFKGTQPDAKYALLADCLIHAGKYQEAVQAWELARHPSFHTGIDFVIYEIYGKLSPLRRRGELVEKIRKGQTDAVEELLILDLFMDSNPWNTDIFEPGLQSDLDLAKEILGGDSARYHELTGAVKILKARDEDDPVVFSKELKNANLIIGNGQLPTNSLIAHTLIESIVLAHKLETPTNLLSRFQTELEKRSRSKTGDSISLNLLCALLAAANRQDELIKHNRYGWERYREPKYAASLLTGLAEKKQLKADSPEMMSALKEFPDNSSIHLIYGMVTTPENLTRAEIVAAIKAEYRQFSSGLPDSYRLKALFELLKKKLASAQ